MEQFLKPPFLLVALPQLQEPDFQKSVLLLTEHNEEGSLGFVINRPSEMPINDIIASDKLEIPGNIPAWYGGPAGTDNGMVLHNQKSKEKRNRFSENFTMSRSETALDELIEYTKNSAEKDSQSQFSLYKYPRIPRPLYPYRFIVGYAGWGPNQLEEEIKLGIWLQLPLNSELLFNTPWQNMWEYSLLNIGVDPMAFAPIIQNYLN